MVSSPNQVNFIFLILDCSFQSEICNDIEWLKYIFELIHHKMAYCSVWIYAFVAKRLYGSGSDQISLIENCVQPEHKRHVLVTQELVSKTEVQDSAGIEREKFCKNPI